MSTTIHQLINSKKNLAKASVSPITVSFGATPEKITEASSSTSIANVTASQISVHSTKNSESNAENSLGLYSPVKTNNEPSESIDPNKSVTALDLIKNIQQTRCPSSQPSSPKLKEENQGYTESFSWIKGIFNHSVESLNGFGFYTPGPSMEGISGSMISQYFSQQKSTADEPAPLTGLVFGVPLQVATLNSLLTRDVPLPAIVIRCVEYLDNYGLNEIGLYRIPGGTSEVMQLKNQFDCGSDLDLSIDPPDPNAVATLLKSFLRELPESILTPKIYKTIQNYMSHYHSAAINSTTVPKIGMMAGERVGGSNKNQLPSHMDPKSRALAEDIGNLVSELPDCNYYLLHWITRHLSRVDSNHQINKMSTSNLSVIFCPTLGIPSNLFKLMVDFNQIIFPLPKPTPQNTKRNLKIKSPRPFSASSISDHLSAKSSVSSISSGLDHLKLKKLDPMNYFNFKLPSQNSSNVPSARNSQDSHKLKNSDSAERFKSRLRKQNPGSRVISPRLYRDFTIVGDMFNIKNPSMLFQGHSSRDSNSGSMKSEVSVKSRNSILSYQSTSINTYPKLTETLQRSKSNRSSQNGRNSHTSLEEIMKPFQELGQDKSQITDEPSTISKDPKDMDHLNLDSFQTPSTIYRTPLSTHVTVDLPTTPNTEIVGSPKEFDASQLDESTILNLFPRIRSKPNSRANSRKGSTSPTSSPTQHKTVTSPSTSSQSPAQQKLGALITPKIVPTPTPAPTTPVAEEIKPDDLLNKLRQGLKKTGIKMVPDDQEEQNQS